MNDYDPLPVFDLYVPENKKTFIKKQQQKKDSPIKTNDLFHWSVHSLTLFMFCLCFLESVKVIE